jgi:hypothetical protein
MVNPRAWSLFKAMNLFDAYGLAHILHKFTQIEMGLILPKMCGQGGRAIDETMNKRMAQALSEAELLFRAVDLPDCLADVSTARHQWERPTLDVSSGCEIVHRLQVDIIDALKQRQFLRVENDRLDLIPHMQGDQLYERIYAVIGHKVVVAFPSTLDDFEEAGNCLAAECNTGGVFHLMRVAEIGLRAVASDRNASFANKPIDQQEWGTIIGYLDGVIKDLRATPLLKWPDPRIKDVQIRFYSEVVGELRGFNEAWRKHLSHARGEEGIYDRDYATSILKHVTKFMQKLAEKISESAKTPEYWTSP